MKTIQPCVFERLYNPVYTNILHKRIARKMAKMAVRALYFEVKAYPKPGLVSFVDSGAHNDMNGETFYRSLFALRHYFYEITLQGLAADNAENIDDKTNNFDQLKKIALKAEAKMLRATKGINTHRGAIFALGIVCVSTARLLLINQPFSPEELHQKIMSDWQKILNKHQPETNSHGSIISKKLFCKNIINDNNNDHGHNQKIITAKEMAIQGYPIVFELLPDFIDLFHTHNSLSIPSLNAYLHLLCHIDDTNILYRKGPEGLKKAKQKAQKILLTSCKETQKQEAVLLHQLFSSERISPGGVGDLIGVLIFLSQLFSEKIQCHY